MRTHRFRAISAFRYTLRVLKPIGDLWQRRPLLVAVLIGACARLASAIVGVGFHARDDYFHVLDPALHWLADPTFDWDHSALAGAGIRSHLVPRAVYFLLASWRRLGVDDPEISLRLIYGIAGSYSLLVVPATFYAARRLVDDRAARWAALLAAAHFAMPYAGTKLLIEAMAMPPLVFGVGLAAGNSKRALLLAGTMVGLACWFRFQVGVAGLGLACAVAIRAWRATGPREAVRQVCLLASGAALAVLLQGLYDLWTTGLFLGPVLHNILANACSAAGGIGSVCTYVRERGLPFNADISRSTPWAYVGVWLLLTVPPLTFVLLGPLLRAARRLEIALPLVAFVVVHSLIAHKEERFMLPVLPLFLLLMAAVPGELATFPGALGERLRTAWPASRRVLVAVHVAALALACTSQSQQNLREAMTHLRKDRAAQSVVSLGPEVQAYFLNRPELPWRRIAYPEAAWLKQTAEDLGAIGYRLNRIIGFATDRNAIDQLQAQLGLDCSAPTELSGWWVDRLIYAVNPARNRRRAPILLWACEPAFLATLP